MVVFMLVIPTIYQSAFPDIATAEAPNGPLANYLCASHITKTMKIRTMQWPANYRLKDGPELRRWPLLLAMYKS